MTEAKAKSIHARMPTPQSGHAVVLGGSISGLLAARVLSDRFARVTILERDRVASDGAPRKAIPQGQHVHGLLARGLNIIDGWFPGFSSDLVAGGATLVGPYDVQIYILGWRKAHDGKLRVLSLTRPFLEWALARRVQAIANVAVVEDAEAIGVRGSAARVTGVVFRRAGTEQTVDADLIVDARGRASNLADWLKGLGLAAPPHETSPLASVYCSYLLEPPAGTARPMIQVVDFAKKLGVLAFPVEAGRVLVSVGANAGAGVMPKSHEEMLALLQGLPVPDAYRALKDYRPLTPLAHSRFTASVRRNFDALDKLPEGIAALGDAVASFNPIFGQGMTVAALEAEWLARCLEANDPSTQGFVRAYYKGLKPIVDLAWAPPDLEAKRRDPAAQPWGTRFMLWYTERMQATASRSARVSRTIAEVQNMLAPPSDLFKPSVFWRVLFA